jgi:hypothetical protein
MEMKKSKVTKATKYDKKDDYGNTSYSVEFENGDKGFFRTKDENQTKFVTGQEAEYEIEEKKGKNDKVYYNVKLPQSERKLAGGGFKGPDPKVQIASFAMAYTKDLIVAGCIGYIDIEKTFDKIHTLMSSKL